MKESKQGNWASSRTPEEVSEMMSQRAKERMAKLGAKEKLAIAMRMVEARKAKRKV